MGASEHERISPWQVGLLVLSMAGVGALVVDAVMALPREVSRTVQFGDTVVCGLLFLDFCWRFGRAESKGAFMKWGWIDLVACVPNVDFLRAGRLVRVLRVIRVLRGFRAGHRTFQIFRENRPRTALASALTIMGLLVAFSSAAILVTENVAESNIKTAEDAIWWSVTTITTVGYGDRYPVTAEGRMIAMALMLCGVGLFGVLSGFVATVLLGKNEEEAKGELKEILARLERIEGELRAARGEGAVGGGERVGK